MESRRNCRVNVSRLGSLKLGSLGVPESAIAGHSNPLTLLHTATGPKYGSISRNTSFSFQRGPGDEWQWHILSSLERVRVSPVVFSRGLYLLPIVRGAGRSGWICLCHLVRVLFESLLCPSAHKPVFLDDPMVHVVAQGHFWHLCSSDTGEHP